MLSLILLLHTHKKIASIKEQLESIAVALDEALKTKNKFTSICNRCEYTRCLYAILS